MITSYLKWDISALTFMCMFHYCGKILGRLKWELRGDQQHLVSNQGMCVTRVSIGLTTGVGKQGKWEKRSKWTDVTQWKEWMVPAVPVQEELDP